MPLHMRPRASPRAPAARRARPACRGASARRHWGRTLAARGPLHHLHGRACHCHLRAVRPPVRLRRVPREPAAAAAVPHVSRTRRTSHAYFQSGCGAMKQVGRTCAVSHCAGLECTEEHISPMSPRPLVAGLRRRSAALCLHVAPSTSPYAMPSVFFTCARTTLSAG
jgi:hypothetical protein